MEEAPDFEEFAESYDRPHDPTQVEEDQKYCTTCGKKKPFIEFDLDKYRPDGRRDTCKRCRSEINAAKRQQKMNEQIAQQEMDNLAKFEELAKQGGSMAPHISEMFESLMEPFGGQRGFARHLFANYIAADPGSQMRFKILQSVMELGKQVTKHDLAERRLEMLEDDDLVREMKRYLGSYQQALGLEENALPTRSGEIIDAQAVPLDQMSELLEEAGAIAEEISEE